MFANHTVLNIFWQVTKLRIDLKPVIAVCFFKFEGIKASSSTVYLWHKNIIYSQLIFQPMVQAWC